MKMIAKIALPLSALLLVAGCSESAAPDSAAVIESNQAALTDGRRVIDLEGGINFRDLGGYVTEDGKQVKWRTVYRSGSPGGLTEKDIATLDDLGIATVCDFRTTAERAAEPNPYVAANGEVEYYTRDYAMQTGNMGALIGGEATPEKTRAAMTEFYRHLPEDNAEAYAQMFAYLAEGRTPLAFNCSAGKDRAGTGAALLLTLLGVPRETVLADYALSDKIVDFKAELARMAKGRAKAGGDGAGAKTGSANAGLASVPWEVIQPIMASDPAYMEAALGALEAEYGSVDAFIEKRLGVTPDMRAAIRERLLVSPERA